MGEFQANEVTQVERRVREVANRGREANGGQENQRGDITW
jgi:hypothetical protein